MSIEETNRLIAEFMDNPIPKSAVKCCNSHNYIHNNHLLECKYNSSWDWLMPVLEKIEKMGVSTEIHYFAGTKFNAAGYMASLLGYSSMVSTYDSSTQTENKITAVYKAVVKFIQYYNNLPKE